MKRRTELVVCIHTLVVNMFVYIHIRLHTLSKIKFSQHLTITYVLVSHNESMQMKIRKCSSCLLRPFNFLLVRRCRCKFAVNWYIPSFGTWNRPSRALNMSPF